MTDIIYHQQTGVLAHDALAWNPSGYSGHGIGLNNPAMEAVHDVGPIPRGDYAIGDWIAHHPDLGVLVAPLTPIGHDAHGRTGFFCHGDNAQMNHSASHGCIIQGHDTRAGLQGTGAKRLRVV